MNCPIFKSLNDHQGDHIISNRTASPSYKVVKIQSYKCHNINISTFECTSMFNRLSPGPSRTTLYNFVSCVRYSRNSKSNDNAFKVVKARVRLEGIQCCILLRFNYRSIASSSFRFRRVREVGRRELLELGTVLVEGQSILPAEIPRSSLVEQFDDYLR